MAGLSTSRQVHNNGDAAVVAHMALQRDRDGEEATRQAAQQPPGGGYPQHGGGGYGGHGGGHGHGGHGGGHGGGGHGGGGYAAQAQPAAATPGAAGAAAGTAAAAGAKKGGLSMGLIAGIVAAVVVIGGAVGAYIFLAGGGAKLSTSVPEDTQIYFEIPSIGGAIKDGAGMGFINAEELDPQKFVDDFRDGIEDAFEIDKEHAQDIVDNIDSIAVAVRDLDERPQQAVIISFKGDSGLQELFKSDRFDKEGSVGAGTRYVVERVKVDDFEEMEDWTAPHKAMAFTAFDEDSKTNQLVYFEEQRLLVAGHEDMIEDISDVIADGDPSLGASEKWGQAKFEGGAAAVLFIDSGAIEEAEKDDDLKDLVKNYLDEVGPIAGTASFSDAGLRMAVHGELKGKAIKEDEPLASAAELDVYKKLPKETVAYIAFSTATDSDGETMKKSIIDQLEDTDEDLAEAAEEAFDNMDDELDISIEEVFDAIGDQMAIAVAIDREIEIDLDDKPDPGELFEKAGIAYLIGVGDKEKAKKLVETLKEKAFEDGPMKEAYDLEDKGDGFDATPEDEDSPMTPTVKVRLTDEWVLIAAGGLAGRFVEAVEDGTDPLSDLAAHDKALSTIKGNPRAIMWADMGWAAGRALKIAEDNDDMEEALEDAEKELGFTRKAFTFEGEDRPTTMVALSLDSDGARWTYSIESLNAPLLGTAGALAFLVPRGVGNFGGPVEVAPPINDDNGGGDGDLPAVCEEALKKYEKCMDNMPSAARPAMQRSLDQMKETWSKLKGNTSALETSCKAMIDGLKGNSYCN